MRQLNEVLAARIESGAARLCHAWIATRVDGHRFGFTDHDQDLVIDGVTCRADSGWIAGVAETEIGFTPGSLATQGVLGDATITEADISAGLWDGAQVVLLRVDWSDPELRVELARASLSRLQWQGDQVTAELDGPLAMLDRVVGRVFSRDCDASLGDARCRVDRSAFPGLLCDRRFATCQAVFDNQINFRGFPDIPGDDFLTATPRRSTRNDGSSRR